MYGIGDEKEGSVPLSALEASGRYVVKGKEHQIIRWIWDLPRTKNKQTHTARDTRKSVALSVENININGAESVSKRHLLSVIEPT